MPGLVSLVGGLGLYLAWWYRHDRGMSLGYKGQINVREPLDKLLRRGGGPILPASFIVQMWALVMIASGLARWANPAGPSAAVEALVWGLGAVAVAITWTALATLAWRERRRRLD